MRDEMLRALRVADMLTSCHSQLRDRFAFRAMLLDIAILLASVWLTAMAFVDPEIAKHFVFFGLSSTLMIGFLAVFTFILSLLQLRTDWKYRAERHEQASKAYLAAKMEMREALLRSPVIEPECERILRNFRSIGERVAAIPERQFNRLKKGHLQKVRMSQALNEYPGRNLLLMRVGFWFADNITPIFRTYGGSVSPASTKAQDDSNR